MHENRRKQTMRKDLGSNAYYASVFATLVCAWAVALVVLGLAVA
jgi:hypothetical protein